MQALDLQAKGEALELYVLILEVHMKRNIKHLIKSTFLNGFFKQKTEPFILRDINEAQQSF